MPLSKVNPLKYFFLLAEVRPGIIRKDLIMREAITQKKKYYRPFLQQLPGLFISFSRFFFHTVEKGSVKR